MVKEYKGISRIIKDGEILKSPKNSYTIKELVSNGINQVYFAVDNSGNKVAIKQFKFNNKEFLNFQYWLYENVTHDFIDKPLDMFEMGVYHFQVKPFYEKFIPIENFASPKIDIKVKKNLVYAIGSFIQYLHSKNIAYTDLKPEQFILVDKKIKLLDFDFGVTDKFYFPGGTEEWYSPEHIKKERIDLKSDIFSFALMSHWLLTNKHPFEKYFETSLEIAILHENYEIDKNFKDLFSRMLKVNKYERIDINTFLNELKKSNSVPKKIYLIMNNQKYLIIKDEIITREICKRNFKNYKEIAPKHFKILKKENGWFLRGFEDVRFDFVLVDGKDATNREIELKNNSIIKIGNTKFKVQF
jgi:serine/threonine protein kinase